MVRRSLKLYRRESCTCVLTVFFFALFDNVSCTCWCVIQEGGGGQVIESRGSIQAFCLLRSTLAEFLRNLCVNSTKVWGQTLPLCIMSLARWMA